MHSRIPLPRTSFQDKKKLQCFVVVFRINYFHEMLKSLVPLATALCGGRFVGFGCPGTARLKAVVLLVRLRCLYSSCVHHICKMANEQVSENVLRPS